MSHKLVLVEYTDHAAILTLNHPPLNSLSRRLIEGLDKSISEVLEQKTYRCLVITGNGEKTFASGADIRELECIDEKDGTTLVTRVKEVFGRIRSCPLPTIAAINAHALGGGLELALHCDFRVADKNARFGLPEINLGVMPGAGGTQILPQLIGIAKARWMLLSGEIVDAQAAFEMGLLDRIVNRDTLSAEVSKITTLLAEKPPLSCRAVKKALLARDILPFPDAMHEESRLFGMLCSTRDKEEGIRAFLEKRKPEFQGI